MSTISSNPDPRRFGIRIQGNQIESLREDRPKRPLESVSPKVLETGERINRLGNQGFNLFSKVVKQTEITPVEKGVRARAVRPQEVASAQERVERSVNFLKKVGNQGAQGIKELGRIFKKRRDSNQEVLQSPQNIASSKIESSKQPPEIRATFKPRPNADLRKAVKVENPISTTSELTLPENIIQQKSKLEKDRERLAEKAQKDIKAIKTVPQKRLELTKFHTYTNEKELQEQLSHELTRQRFDKIVKLVKEFNQVRPLNIRTGKLFKNLKDGKNQFTIEGETFLFKPSGKLYVKTKEYGGGAFKDAPSKMVLVASLQPEHLNKKEKLRRVEGQIHQEIKARVLSSGMDENEAVINRFMTLMAKEGYDLSRINLQKGITYISKEENQNISKQVGSMAMPSLANVNSLISQPLGHPDHLTNQEILYIGWQMAEAVAVLHETLGIVHRDLKPDNFLLSRNEQGQIQIKVNDFGFSSLTAEGADRHYMGTEGPSAYLAPELFDTENREQNCDFATDVYELTMTILHTFARKNIKQFREEIQENIANWESDPTIPSDLKEYIKDASHPVHREYAWKKLPEKWPLYRQLAQSYPRLAQKLLGGANDDPLQRPTARELATYLKKEYSSKYRTEQPPPPPSKGPEGKEWQKPIRQREEKGGIQQGQWASAAPKRPL